MKKETGDESLFDPFKDGEEEEFFINAQEKSAMMEAMEILWTVFYWVTFVNCWAILPFMTEYVTAGEFTRKGKIIRSIVNNLIFYSVAGVFFVFFLVYLYVKDAFHDVTFKGFVIALSNAWGLFLIIIFLSHGLTSVPKHFFEQTSIHKMLNKAYFQVSISEESL